jgi:hypothetical protein
VTCPFLVLVVTAHARRGSPDDQGGTDSKRTRVRGSAPGGRPGLPGLPRCRAAVLSVGLWWPLGPTSERYPRRAWLGAPAGLPRTRSVTSREYVHHLLADGAQSGPRRASGSPTVWLITGWLAGRGSVGAGCTTSGAIQLGGLSAPAVLGTEDPKRVERHAQAPPKYHPNRPECSTATERPDANEKQVDDHVGEEDAVERLPGRPGR